MAATGSLLSSAAYQPEVHTSSALFVCAANFVLVGWAVGAVGLYDGLVRAGTLRGVCSAEFKAEAHDATVVCRAQAVMLAQLFQLVACFNGLFSWPLGVLSDVFGAAALLRAFIIGAGVFFAIIGVWPEFGVSAKIGLLGFAVCAGGVMLISTSAVIPTAASGDPDALDTWLLRATAAGFAGFLAAFPLGLFAAWHGLPFWLVCVLCGLAIVLVFKTWFEVSSAELLEHPRSMKGPRPGPFRVRGLEFFKDRMMQVAACSYGCAQSLATAFTSASPRLLPMFGLTRKEATYVPLVFGVAAAVVVGLHALPLYRRYATRQVEFATRFALLFFGVLIGSLDATRSPAWFWVLCFLVGFWSTSAYVASVQISAGADIDGDPVRMGAMLTMANFVTMLIGQPLTYAIAENHAWMRGVLVVSSLVCIVIEVPMLRMAAQQYEAIRSTMRVPLTPQASPAVAMALPPATPPAAIEAMTDEQQYRAV